VPRPSDLIRTAEEHRRAGRADEAALLYGEVLDAAPADVDAAEGLATLEHGRGAHGLALVLLTEAARRAPGEGRLRELVAGVRATLRRRAGGLPSSGHPWTLQDLAQRPRVWKYAALSSCPRVHGSPVRHQPVLFVGPGEVVLGRDVQFGWPQSPLFYTGYCYVEVAHQDARIELGDRVEFNNNAMLKSEGAGIRVGRDGLFGANVEIFDSNFHDLDPHRRRAGRPRMAPVDIGENVFVGMGVKILQGVTIGANSVIGAGAIVASSIPADVVAGGNPARVIRAL
jgi:acetyltransferase-like isoleucine patch superfamily enzyme